MNDRTPENEGRRRLLKQITAAGAAVGTVAALPDRWTKPLVDAVIVPLHAQTSPSLVDPASLAGSWTGTWTDVSAGTNGAASMTVTVQTSPDTFVIVLDLDGPVLGGADPGPQTFNGTYSGAGGDICCQVVSRFGVPSITITPTGAISGSVAPLPEIGSIQISGVVTPTALTINFDAVVGPGSQPHQGTLSLTK